MDAGNPSVGTTLLQPFGEGICPKGTHHPPGLGQGPGQGERFASDGSYIASGANSAFGTSRGRSRSGSNSCAAADGEADAADVAGARRNSSEGSVHQPQQLSRTDSLNRDQDGSSDRSSDRRLTIVIPGDKGLRPPPPPPPLQATAGGGHHLFPEKKSPNSVSAVFSGASIDPSAKKRSPTPPLLLLSPGGVDEKPGVGVGLDHSAADGDAGEPSPVWVPPPPPPGSVTLVKPRVKRVRLKVSLRFCV